MSRTSEQLENQVKSIGEQLEEIASGGKYWIITENWEYSGDGTMYEYPDLIDELLSEDKMQLLRHVYDGLVALDLDVPMGLLEETINNDDGSDSITEEECWKVLRSLEDSGDVLKALKDQDIIEAAAMRHYFTDALDYETTINRQGGFKEIEFTVAWGGPNIFVNSRGEVNGHWGGDKATYHLDWDTKCQISDHGEELYSLAQRNPDAFSRF